MLEPQTFSSYVFSHPESHPESCQTNDADMKYTKSENNNRKEEKSNLKRSIRRRVEKVRNFRSSDMESDTGSDGLAVNSEGSGRSGDWGPPKIRRKSKSYRKRQEARTSLTDSGISLSKTDLESLSGLSINTHSTPEYRQLNSYQRILHDAYYKQQQSKNSAENTICTEATSSLEYPPASEKTSQANDAKECDSTNNNDTEKGEADAIDIEEKEKAILEQCLKNEKLANNSEDNKYIVDCSDAVNVRKSKFPLPDHLNYPICRYRVKSESNNRGHPLKRLKDSWKKFRSGKLFHDKNDCTADTNCYPEFYPKFVVPVIKEDDNEAILSRLSRNPNQRKNFAKRVFDRLGSKSYSTNHPERFEDHNRVNARIPRSGSTRSVPDALQDMWHKVHYKDDFECEPTNRKALHKVTSMPSIHTNVQKENICQDNYFSQTDNYTETHLTHNVRYHNSEKVLSAGNDLVDGLSGLQITQHQDTDCIDKAPDRKVCFNDNTKHYYDDYNKCYDDDRNNSLTKSSKKYSSCHELYQRNTANQKTNYMIPPMFYPPTAPCACCMQVPPVQYMPFYPYPHYVYQVPPYGGYPPPMDFVPNVYPAMQNFYPGNGGEQAFHMGNGVQRTFDDVVAPLDVKIEHEKKAEKRKISEMVFDTFV